MFNVALGCFTSNRTLLYDMPHKNRPLYSSCPNEIMNSPVWFLDTVPCGELPTPIMVYCFTLMFPGRPTLHTITTAATMSAPQFIIVSERRRFHRDTGSDREIIMCANIAVGDTGLTVVNSPQRV